MSPENTSARNPFNPFSYSLAELAKMLVAAIGFVGFAIFYLANTGWSPDLIPAIQALVPTGLAVIVVFLASNHTAVDLNKALMGLVTAAYGVFHALPQIHPPPIESVAVIVGYISTFIGVAWARNSSG